MKVEFRKAQIPGDLPALMELDRQIFSEYPEDLFSAETWRHLDSYWLVADGQRVGCSAFIHHIDADERPRPGALYIMTTGVLPEYRNRGLGKAQKEWQIEFAKQHGFKVIVTNSRQSNTRMIELNKKFGFEVRAIVPNYYSSPVEAAVVMELKVGATQRKSKRKK